MTAQQTHDSGDSCWCNPENGVHFDERCYMTADTLDAILDAAQNPPERPSLVEFLRARYAEKRAVAARMREAVWPDEVHVLPKDDTGDYGPDEPHARLTIGPQYTKRYATVWESKGPMAGPLVVDDTWREPHAGSVDVWSEKVADEIDADLDAKLRIVDLYTHVRYNDEGQPYFCGSGEETWYEVLQLLALPFAAHPDYDENWGRL